MLLSIISFIAVFSLIVIVHESGHFIAARRAGIKVYEFSIGFPFSPKLCTLFTNRETSFTLRLFPIGGFVTFSSENDKDASGLFNASYIQRAAVFSAGSLFNILFAFIVFTIVFAAGQHNNILTAMLSSLKIVWQIFSGTVMFIASAFTGHASINGLSGPIGIAAMAGKAAGMGMLHLLFFSGVLSMSLGVMNLLPLPALDGGQILLLLIEATRKKTISVRTYQIVSIVGLMMFMILTVVVTYRDIVKLIA
jgi:regulator of sigma E protease